MDELDKARLDALDKKLQALEEKSQQDEAKGSSVVKYTHIGLAYRMVIELASGVLIGLAIGLGLDALFGTKPWLMVVMILIGMAAGIRVMMQSAAEFQRHAQKNEEKYGD